jgi:hypothetical protein
VPGLRWVVLMEGINGADAVVDRPQRSLVLRAGRIAAERGAASGALKTL